MMTEKWNDLPDADKNHVLKTLAEIAKEQRTIVNLKMQRFHEQLIETELPAPFVIPRFYTKKEYNLFSNNLDRKYFPGYIARWPDKDKQKIQDLADDIYFFVSGKIESDEQLDYYYNNFYELFPEVVRFGSDYYFGSMTAGPGRHSIFLAFEMRLKELQELESEK